MLTTSCNETAKKIVATALQIDKSKVGHESSIDTLTQWDSLRHFTVITVLETHLNRPLSVDEILIATSVKGLANILENHGSEGSTDENT